MRRLSRSEGVPAPFLDLAFGVIFAFLAVILISTVEEPKKANDPAPIPKAEFLIVMTWDNNSVDDLDLYCRLPNGHVVYFRNKQDPAAFLDVDNTGASSNTIQMPDGTVTMVPTRQETITIRAILPGDYAVNTHFYRKSSPPGFVDHVHLRVAKLNPYVEVTQASANFDAEGEEKTLANFTVDSSGDVSSVYLAPVKLVGNAGDAVP